MVNEVDPNHTEELDLRVQTGLQAGRPLGDVVADITYATGLDCIATTFSDMTGNDCGCDRRQEALNRLVPNTPL